MLRSLKSITAVTGITPHKSLTGRVKFFACELPQQTHFFKWTKEEKKLIYFNKPVPKMMGNMYDTLQLPKANRSDMMNLLRDFLAQEEKVISMQNCGMLMYNLVQENIMIPQALQRLERSIYKHKGEYDSRTTFGCLYGAICLNNTKLIDFFLREFDASALKPLPNECFQLILALNKNKSMTLQQKHQFWQSRFKSTFLETFPYSKQRNVTKIFTMFDAFVQFEYYDEEIWDKLLSFMENKNGWIRTVIVEKLYPLTGTFPKAKRIFNRYYAALSINRNVIWRYNLQELRFYSAEEMIAKSQENIKLSPKNFSVFTNHKEALEYNRQYLECLEKGEVKGQKEIIRDKAQSFAYAIKDRFYALKEDGVDFSTLSQKEFEELFGKYDKELMKEQDKEQEGEAEGQE